MGNSIPKLQDLFYYKNPDKSTTFFPELVEDFGIDDGGEDGAAVFGP
jgi:hypothetical protein